jgi:hypothetical protein
MSYPKNPSHFSLKSAHLPLLHNHPDVYLLDMMFKEFVETKQFEFLICWKQISLWSHQFFDD